MVELIYQGTEVDRFTPTKETKKEAVKRYPLPKNAGPILGSVGSFEERKGQTVLLEAVKKLSEGKLPNVHAMLVGDGPDEVMLKEKVKKMKLENNVSFFSFTSEPNYIFERLDILTLPSLYKEGLPKCSSRSYVNDIYHVLHQKWRVSLKLFSMAKQVIWLHRVKLMNWLKL